MQLSQAPTKIVLPFAADGGKNSPIPVPSQIGVTPGAASFTDGFPPLTRTPVAAGGIPPSGLDMNGVLFMISALSLWANAGAGFVYDNSFATNSNVDGYPKGSRLLRSDGTGYWLNTEDNNTVDPESSGAAAAGWVPDTTNGIAAVTMTNANVTLTELQYGKPIIVISGTLSANLNLIFPPIANNWTVINNTTGAFTITCKTASGSGITVSSIQDIVGDGTNIYGVSISIPVTSAPVQGSFKNLKGSWTSNTAANWTADQIVMQAGSGAPFKFSAYNESLNTTITGAGGLDSGSIAASTWYFVYAIYNPTTPTISILASTSATAPTLPSGYIYAALIGSVYSNASSNLVNFIQYGRDIQYIVPAQMASGSTGGSFGAVGTSAFVPPNASKIKIYIADNNSSGGGFIVGAAPNNSYSTGNSPIQIANANTVDVNSCAMGEFILESSNIYYSSNSGVSFMSCMGYSMNL